MTSRPRLVFMGSPDFAVPVLTTLAGAYPVVGVVTQPDRPAGRGRALLPPPIKRAAQSLGIPLLQPEKLHAPEVMAQLRAWTPELIVVAAFGQILRPELLDLPHYGCLNVHASLLPRWRGAAPVQAAILAGDAETGTSLMKMDPGVDTGPVLDRRAIPIAPDDTAGRLFEKLALLGAQLLIESLPRYLSGELQPRPQSEVGVTYAKMLKKEDELLDFSRSSEQLARQVRALAPSPGAYFVYNGKPIKVQHAAVMIGEAQPGKRLVHQGWPVVGTGAGLLKLEDIQPAGKKPMSGKAFLAGAREWEST